MKYWLAGLFITVSTTVLSEDVIVYRWVDKDNVVHFSQNQPASGNYTEIVMASSGQPKKPLGNVATTVKNIPEKTTAIEKSTVDVKLDTTDQCKEAKTNLATLTTFDRIRFTDKKGETQILSKEAQEEQVTLSKKLIEEFCK